VNDVIIWGDGMGVSAELSKLAEDRFQLRWTDGVINTWIEDYPTLSVALARLAVLVACGESGWEANFAETDREMFGVAAEIFLMQQVC
jgi:hypothetical protein